MSRRKKHVADLSDDFIAELAGEAAQQPRPRVIHDTEVRRLGVRVHKGGQLTWVIDGRRSLGPCDELSSTAARRVVAAGVEESAPTSTWTWRKGVAFYAEKHRTVSGRKAGDSPPVASKLSQIEKHAPFINERMESTSPQQVADFLGGYLDRGKKTQHNAIRRALVTIWNHSFAHGKVSRGSPVLVKSVRETPRRDFMTKDELSEFFALLRECKHGRWTEAYAKLSYSLALRGHEALSMSWAHVGADAITVPQRKTSGQFRWRIYTMTREALAILEGLRNEFDRMVAADAKKGFPMNLRQRESDALFPAPRGGVGGWVELPRELSRVAAKRWPGRKLTSHTLRRSRCTHLRNDGKTDLQICGLSGHSNARQLQRYLGDPPDVMLDELDV